MSPHKNAFEWLVFGVSAILIACVAAVLVSAGARSGRVPPSLIVETGRAERSGETFRLPVRVRNAGDTTAEAARIVIELTADGTVIDRAELTFAFVPQHSAREGWVELRRDPRCCAITSRSAFNAP